VATTTGKVTPVSMVSSVGDCRAVTNCTEFIRMKYSAAKTTTPTSVPPEP
jgi:hypothetical protein